MFLWTFFSSVLRPVGVRIGDIISSHALVRYLLRHVTVTVLFLYIDVIGGISKWEFVYTQNDFRMDSRFLQILSCLHVYAPIHLCVEPEILEDPVLVGTVTRVPWYGTLTDVTGPLAHPNFGNIVFRTHACTLHQFLMSAFYFDVIDFGLARAYELRAL